MNVIQYEYKLPRSLLRPSRQLFNIVRTLCDEYVLVQNFTISTEVYDEMLQKWRLTSFSRILVLIGFLVW